MHKGLTYSTLIALLAGAYAGLVAQDACSGEWKAMAAKTPDAKVVLKLATTKEGQSVLQWPNPSGETVKMEIHKAKAPVNAQGQITMCTAGQSIMSFAKSTSLKDLQKDEKLEPGYYGVRVSVGFYAGHPGDGSDWITIQIK